MLSLDSYSVSSDSASDRGTESSLEVWFINYLLMHELRGCVNGARQKNFQ